MTFFDLFRYFLILIVPGLIGALAFSIAARFRTEINIYVALIIDSITFIIMITGLYFFHAVFTVDTLLSEFNCLSFTRNYALLSILIAIIVGVVVYFLIDSKPAGEVNTTVTTGTINDTGAAVVTGVMPAENTETTVTTGQ